MLCSLPQLQLLSEPHEQHPGAGTPPASAGSRAGLVPGSVQGWQGSRQHRATPVPSTALGHSPRGATTDLPGPPTPPGGTDGTPEAMRRQLMSPPAHQQCQGWLPTSCLGAGEGLHPPRGHRDRATGSVRAAKAPAGRKEPAPAHASHCRDTAPGHHSPRQHCAAWAGLHVAGPMGLLWGRNGAPTPHAGGERGRPRRAHRGWEPGCPPAGAEALDAGGAVQAGGWTPPRPLPTWGGPSPGTDADSPETTPRPRR